MEGKTDTVSGAAASCGPLGERLYGTLRNRDLALRAASAALVAAFSAGLGLAPHVFAVLYALQLGAGLCLTVPMMYHADAGHRHGSRDAVWAGLFLLVLWLPMSLVVVGAWSAQVGGAWSGLVLAVREDGLVLLLALIGIVGAALARGCNYLALGRAAGSMPDLKRAFIERTLCIVAFVFFGPPLAWTLIEFQVPAEWAVLAGYALSEAYPFLATLADRGLGHPRRWH